jgi:hypothetical protein
MQHRGAAHPEDASRRALEYTHPHSEDPTVDFLRSAEANVHKSIHGKAPKPSASGMYIFTYYLSIRYVWLHVRKGSHVEAEEIPASTA